MNVHSVANNKMDAFISRITEMNRTYFIISLYHIAHHFDKLQQKGIHQKGTEVN